MPLDETVEIWCRLFGYASCFYVPPEMTIVLGCTALLSIFAVMALLFGFLQKLAG
jgi:hypothetical protein